MSEKRFCPHCNHEMEYWQAPSETGWGMIYVCFNNQCSFYRNSVDDILYKEGSGRLGYRYAEDPANNYHPINMLAYCPF